MVSLLWNFHSVNPATSPETTLPNIEMFADYIYQGWDVGSVVFPSYPADQTAIDSFLGISAPPVSRVLPSSVSVSVVNGSGQVSTANTMAARLDALGFPTSVGPAQAAVGTPAETLVEYSSSHLLDAERVTQSLSGIVSMVEVASTHGADVTLVAGTNFHVVTPRTRAPSPTAGATSLGPVSPAVQALPSYDPRACPAT
jgi:hypothetical protein